MFTTTPFFGAAESEGEIVVDSSTSITVIESVASAVFPAASVALTFIEYTLLRSASIGLAKCGAALKLMSPDEPLIVTVAESALGLKVHVDVSFAVNVPTIVWFSFTENVDEEVIVGAVLSGT